MKKISKLEYALREAIIKFDLETEMQCEMMRKKSGNKQFLLGDDCIYSYRLMREEQRDKLIIKVVNKYYNDYQRVHSKLKNL